MKYCFLIAMVLSAYAAAAQKTFELNGSLAGKNNIRVALLRDPFGNTKELASDTIRNGRFHFKCPFDEVTLISIGVYEDRMRTTYTVVMEPASITFKKLENGSTVVDGGKYNQEILGYQKLPAFKQADEAFRQLTNGGQFTAVKGTDKEWDAIQLFTKKNEIMTNYLVDKMNNSKDPRTQVMAALMANLQPNADAAMAVVNKAAKQLGDSSFLIRAATTMKAQQDMMVSNRKNLMTGKPYIDFKAATIEGDSVRLANVVQKNKYTLVQFWASWCVPCRREIPLLKELYQNYKAKGLEIISFSLDDNRNNWVKATEMEKFSWINISDLKSMTGAVSKAYGISSIPANVIIDQQGKVVASNLTGKELEDKINTLMQ